MNRRPFTTNTHNPMSLLSILILTVGIAGCGDDSSDKNSGGSPEQTTTLNESPTVQEVEKPLVIEQTFLIGKWTTDSYEVNGKIVRPQVKIFTEDKKGSDMHNITWDITYSVQDNIISVHRGDRATKYTVIDENTVSFKSDNAGTQLMHRLKDKEA